MTNRTPLFRLIVLVSAGAITLLAATIVPARAMKVDKEVGTVEKGKRADLIILDDDPLQSMGNIRKVRSVIRSGRLFDCAQLWKAAGFMP
jgi:imidazolonepropionase-like amidohydrolase